MPNRIARKLIIVLILFSSVITLIITVLQLYFEYEDEIAAVNAHFVQVERSYLKSISENIWEEDPERLVLLINGIAEFPGIEFVRVRDSDGKTLASVGHSLVRQSIKKNYLLNYTFRGAERLIGDLEVVASLSAIYQQLFKRFGIILASNAIKTLLISTFLFAVINWLLTSQLDSMTRFTKSMDLSKPMPPLQLKRGVFSGRHDEVDQLADALNYMQKTLSDTFSSLKESEQRFRQLAENINEVFWLGSPDWNKVYYLSPAFEKLWGMRCEDIYESPKRWMDSVHADDREQLLADIPGKIEDIEDIIDFKAYRVKQKDGLIRWIKARAYPIRDGSGQIIRIAGIAEDITESKQAEEELRKLSRAIESSSSAIFITNKQGTIEYVNPRFSDQTGYSKEVAIGKAADFLRSSNAKDSIFDDLWQAIASGEDWRGELDNQTRNGMHFRARVSISAVKDALGETTHFIGIQDDVTHEYLLTEQLNYQATHDALTGLYNRIEFERRSEQLFASSRGNEVEHALCFMDLDQFKLINDTCGHIAGDELLRQLSRVLQGAVRQNDTLARLGGDEFGVLMEHCSLDQAHRVAESLLKSIQEYQFVWEGKYFHVGVSIGLVAITHQTTSLSELLKQADAACYMAKDLGRNRIHEYHIEDSGLAQRQGEMLWVNRISQALEENRLCLYAQPIVPLDHSTQEHYELLVRMVEEDGTIIQPGDFLPAAERYDLISKIDEWVMNNAFKLLSTHVEFVDQIDFICINLSGASLTSGAFLDSIFMNLNKAGFTPDKICFEVTETVAISNLSAAITFIRLLKDTGFRFALDDFGSGLSSFGYLKNLPVDFLKIDGMFVKDIVDDPIDYAMVKSINEIGQVMGMQTIAEFVENDEIMQKLRLIGVDFAQGYGVGKPQPLEELIKNSQTTGS